MPDTPPGRYTRSNSNPQTLKPSNPQNVSLRDIKSLIEGSTSEILKAVKSDIEGVRNDLKILNQTLSSLVDKVATLDSRTKVLETKVDFLEHETMSRKQTPHLSSEDMFQEIEERARRRKYLIVSGVQELISGTLDERKRHDTEFIQKLSKEMGVEDFEPEDVRRIGQIGGTRPRLLRFKCGMLEKKRTFLRQAKTLRKSPAFERIYVNPDLTKNQRIKEAELRAELKRRRGAGENVFIRRGCLVVKTDEEDQGFHSRF